MSQIKNCPQCNTENPTEANFCRHCGFQFCEYDISVLEKQNCKLRERNKKLSRERDEYKSLWFKSCCSVSLYRRWCLFLAVGLFLTLLAGIVEIIHIGRNKDIECVEVEEEELVQPSIDEALSDISNKTAAIPDDFVLIEGGRLTHYLEGYEEYDVPIYKDIDLDSYYICKHEVTQKEYEEVMHNIPSTIIGDNLPVNTIDVLQACQYCNERSKQEGYCGFYTINGKEIEINHKGNGYRLPTVYEWALASRPSFSTKTKYAGGDNIKEIAWYGGNSKGTLHEVCTKKSNKRGIYDLNGNVTEWLWAKPFHGNNVQIGSEFSSYISFGEDDQIGNWQVQVYNGFRVVLIKDSCANTTFLGKIKAVAKPYSEKR